MVNSSDSTSLLWNTPPLVPVANLTTVQCTVCIGQSAPSPHLDKIPPNCLRFLPFIRQLDSKTKSSNFQIFQSWQIMIILFQTIFKVLARSHRDQTESSWWWSKGHPTFCRRVARLPVSSASHKIIQIIPRKKHKKIKYFLQRFRRGRKGRKQFAKKKACNLLCENTVEGIRYCVQMDFLAVLTAADLWYLLVPKILPWRFFVTKRNWVF